MAVFGLSRSWVRDGFNVQCNHRRHFRLEAEERANVDISIPNSSSSTPLDGVHSQIDDTVRMFMHALRPTARALIGLLPRETAFDPCARSCQISDAPDL